MHASRLTICSWKGADRLDDVVSHPDSAAIELALRRLDAEQSTELFIEAADGSSLIIGGGKGQYIGFVGRSDEEIHNLICPQGSSERQVELCTGGQTGFYSERQVIDFGTALQAARTFAERGELDVSVAWERQCSAL